MVKKMPFRTGLTDSEESLSSSEESLSERSEISLPTNPPVAAPEPAPYEPNDINDGANIPNKDQGPVEDLSSFRWWMVVNQNYSKKRAVLDSLEDERDELLLQLPPGGYFLYLRCRRVTLPECSY